MRELKNANRSSMILRMVMMVLAIHVAANAASARSNFAERSRLPRNNVIRELKLSPAQRDEIRASVRSFSDECEKLRRTRKVLEEDKRLAQLRQEPDEREIERIQEELYATQREIHRRAVKKMREITSMLSAGQTKRLNAMKREEYERLTAEKDKGKGDVSSDTPREPMSFGNFSMMTRFTGADDRWFDADEVFCYPERELWMDDASGGGAFSFGGGDEGNVLQNLQGLEPLLGKLGTMEFFMDMQPREGRLEGPFEQRNFEFRMRTPDGRERSTEEFNGMDELMDDTPYTLPKPRGESKSDSDSHRPKNNDNSSKDNIRRQMNELKRKLDSLEKELRSDE